MLIPAGHGRRSAGREPDEHDLAGHNRVDSSRPTRDTCARALQCFGRCRLGRNRYARTVTGHTIKVDRLLIRTAAGQAGIGDNDGHITCNAPTGKSPKESRRSHRHQPSPIPSDRPGHTHSHQTRAPIAGAEHPLPPDRWCSSCSLGEDADCAEDFEDGQLVGTSGRWRRSCSRCIS